MTVSRDLYQQWKQDEQAPLQGWDFSYLKGRWEKEQPMWNYKEKAKRLVEKAEAVLDMGTGGGEIFSSFAPFPKHTIAIEDWEPNVPIAKKRLEPLGVKVLKVNESYDLPFAEGEFDVVLNRHSAFSANEIFRILKTDGVFLTQQVGGGNLNDLIREFDADPKYKDWTLETIKKEILDAGFEIQQAEKWIGKVRFKDVGAIVYFLKVIPWIIESFSVDNNLHHLEKLQEKIDRDEKLSFSETRFLVFARKS